MDRDKRAARAISAKKGLQKVEFLGKMIEEILMKKSRFSEALFSGGAGLGAANPYVVTSTGSMSIDLLDTAVLTLRFDLSGET
ncbi:hypothetical protein [Sinorhizobium meliloti]|uniref:hypothetical protein n=1 Tax=Rhizobium meliloti TaxID=382 RepID=UPI0030CC7BCD